LLGRDGKVYHADLHERTVDVVLDGPGVRSAAIVPGPTDPVRGTPNRLGVRTEDAVLLLDERGKLLKRYAIPEALRDRDLTFAETHTGGAVMYWNSPPDWLATESEYRIAWVSPEGRCRTAEVSLAAPGDLRSMQALGGVVVPSPLGLAGYVVLSRSSDLLDKGLAGTHAEALGRGVREFGWALGIAQLVAAAFAVLCYRRQVRYGAAGRERIVWPLFVLLLGLPGWVGYRFGRSWPVLEACPACAAEAPRDRRECVRCEADYPRPARKGTEVFA
jgi:hypothetical protein